MSKVRGQKRQLEKARQEKAAAKRDRRQSRDSTAESTPESTSGDESSPEYAQDEVLAALADLHRRFGDEALSLEEFEESRDELVRRLRIE